MYRIPSELANAASGSPQYFWVAEQVEVLLWRDGERLRAFSSICPHMGAPFDLRVAERALVCPWHGLRQSLEPCSSGSQAKEYRVDIRDGDYWIDV